MRRVVVTGAGSGISAALARRFAADGAGLLSLLGSASYAVTKHGALAYAEWLRATYAHRGLIVQALCPQGVRTDMLTRGDEDEQLRRAYEENAR